MTTSTDTTAEVLASMMTENTGRHMLDSGGVYGRSWERNGAAVQASDMSPVEYFDSTPDAWMDYGSPTISVYHFLKGCLEYNPKLDRAWRTWVGLTPWDYGTGRSYNGYSDAGEFVRQLEAKGWADSGDEWNGMTVNTYNHESLLSQTIQYTLVTLTDQCPWGEGTHALMSIHGGCDVRGGYTDYRAFEADVWGDSGKGLLDDTRAGLYCDSDHIPVHPSQLDLDGKTPQPTYYRVDYASGYMEADPYGAGEPVYAEDDEYKNQPLCPLCGQPLEASLY